VALACEAKANLHPLAFYTIEFTSPFSLISASKQPGDESYRGRSNPDQNQNDVQRLVLPVRDWRDMVE
jgi:hypothetical protein